MTRRGWALFAAMGVIWGLPYLLIRVSVREVSPAFLVFVRTAGGAALLAPFTVRRGMLAPLLAHWRALVAYTVVELGVPWWVLFSAEKKVTSSLAGLLVAAVPIAGAVIARATGSDRLDGRRVAGLGLGLAGVAALVGFDVGRSDLLAAASFLLVVIGYALGPWVLARHLADVPARSVVTASLALCAVAYAPLAVIQHPTAPLSGSVLASMATLMVICTAIAFMLFFALIAEVGPMRATVITYVNPAIAVVLGVAVLGESFGPWTAAGFAAVLGGSVLATRPLRPRPQDRPVGAQPGPIGAPPMVVGAPDGQVGAQPGPIGAPPMVVGAPDGQVGAQPGPIGAPPMVVGAPDGQVGSQSGPVGAQAAGPALPPGAVSSVGRDL